jgi:hypothetical protein
MKVTIKTKIVKDSNGNRYIRIPHNITNNHVDRQAFINSKYNWALNSDIFYNILERQLRERNILGRVLELNSLPEGIKIEEGFISKVTITIN